MDEVGAGRGVLGVASVEIDSGYFPLHAHREIAASTFIADEIMAAVPADAHSSAYSPSPDALSKSVKMAGDFVTRDTWILQARP